MNAKRLFLLALALLPLFSLAQAQSAPQESREARMAQQKRILQQRMNARRNRQNQVPNLPDSVPLGQGISGTLAPGESVSFHDVTMTWHATTKDENTTEPLGFLSFKAPKASLPHVKLSTPTQPPGVNAPTQIYINETVFSVNYRNYIDTSNGGVNVRNSVNQVAYTAGPVASETLAGPEQKEYTLYVSNACPAVLNKLALSVSDAPAIYPDGSTYYQLTVQDTENGQKSVMAMTLSAQKQFGRFKLTIDGAHEASKTAELKVEAALDPTVRGGDTCVTHMEMPSSRKLGDFLSLMARDYQFEVEWVASPPDHPESIDYVKNQEIVGYPQPSSSGITLRDLLVTDFGLRGSDRDINITMKFEWPDSSHLRVTPQGFEQIVAQNDAQKKALAENIKAEAKKAQEMSRLAEQFAKEFTGQPQIIKLDKVSAKTAGELIEPVLSVYYLLGGPADASSPVVPVQQGKYACIATIENPRANNPYLENLRSNNYIKREFIERVTLDEKANTLTATVTPQTYQKIREILYKAELTLAAGKKDQPLPKQYRIELFLLAVASADEEKSQLTALKEAGLSAEALKGWGIEGVKIIGKERLALTAEPGEMGKALVALYEGYRCELQFLETRGENLIVKGSLLADQPILANTMFLEKTKPALLGQTDWKGTVYVVARRLP